MDITASIKENRLKVLINTLESENKVLTNKVTALKNAINEFVKMYRGYDPEDDDLEVFVTHLEEVGAGLR
jgi:hypothetical protein